MVDAVVAYALQKLGDFLIQKVVHRKKIRDDVEWIKDELGYMKALLKDAEQNHNMDHRVQLWVCEVSDLAHDVVDIVDEFISKVASRETLKKGIADRIKRYASIGKKEANIYDIGNKIESLRQRIIDLSRRKDTYGITSITSPVGEGSSSNGQVNTTNMRKWRRTTSYAEEEHFVGFEDVTDMLLEELHKHEDRRSVISIYGMGGLGKTTLARKLYNSVYFACRAWVCVSQEYSIQDLLRTIIKSFKTGCDREVLERMNEEDLERHLREFLNEKRYLVVVDDVWHKEAWESLKRAFPDHRNGSRVIITTRKKEVAERVDDRSFVYQLRFLRSEESYDLFCKKIMGGDKYAHRFCPEMQEIGKEIVGKCGGLPLAIVVLGGLLSHKNDPQHWRKVKDQLWQHMKEDSINISHILSLSYDDLSSELKQCFLYIGIFPEDYVIFKEKLMQLWMAEGFISQVNIMEDIAENYLLELIDRSLIQVFDQFNVKIHDILRELAVDKARENRFFDIFDPRANAATHSRRQRLAIHTQIEKFFSVGIYGDKLRSLVFFNPDSEHPDIGILKVICRKFNLLCVLDLEKVSFVHSKKGCPIPDAIGDLIHLKFLNLYYTNITQLPSSIGNLKSLQTLTISYSRSFRLPEEICKLINLRHLSIFMWKGNVNMNTLTNLRTLKGVNYDQWTLVDTTNICNIRELYIHDFAPIKDRAYTLDSVSNLKSLTTLYLFSTKTKIELSDPYLPSLEPLFSCPRLLKLQTNGKIKKLPLFNKFPTSLTNLTLEASRLSEDPMPILEKLFNLRDLCLAQNSYDGKEITCSNGGFLRLEHLKLNDLPNLENWKLADTSMPMIKSLSITDCPKLMTIPERLKSINERDRW